MRKKIVPALLAVFLGAASFVCFAHLYAEDATLQDSKPKDAAQKDTIQKDATSKSDPPGAEGQSDRQNDDIPVLQPSSYWIGVQVIPVPDLLLSQFDERENSKGLVVVEQVVPDSPAEKCGVKRGDVILEFGGADIHQLQDIVRKVADVKETEQTLTVIRSGKKLELKVTPALRPVDLPMMGRIPFPGGMQGRMAPLPGMHFGPDVWIGPRDPQKMREMQERMKEAREEMEEQFRRMQKAMQGDPQEGDLQDDFDGERLAPPQDGKAAPGGTARIRGENLVVREITDAEGKTTIQVQMDVKTGDKTATKTWEAESVDKLPDEIRGTVEKTIEKIIGR